MRLVRYRLPVLLALAVAGYFHLIREVKTMPQEIDIRDQELETRIMLLQSPFGGAPHEHERQQAADWLVAHAARAYPRLLAGLTAGMLGRAVIQLMPRFGRAETIPVLERLLWGSELFVEAAAQALALHPQREAGEALDRALARPEPGVVKAAADALITRGDRAHCPALITRGDRAHCPALIAALKTPEPIARYHVVQAAGTLGCLQPAELAAMSRTDPDPEVRELAAKLRARLSIPPP
jgi:HEAT repeat protein